MSSMKVMYGTIVVLCVILLAVPSVQAGNCGIGYSNGYGYSSTYYNSAPSYSYSNSYYPTALVPVLSAIFVPAPSYVIGTSAPVAVATQTSVTPATLSTTTQTTQTSVAGSVNGSTTTVDLGTKLDTIMHKVTLMESSFTNKLTSMETRLTTLESKNGPTPGPKVANPEELKRTTTQKVEQDKLIGLLSTNCASCHSAGVPDEKSAGFYMFDKNKQFDLSKDGDSSDAAGKLMVANMIKKITKERKCPGAAVALTGPDKDFALKVLQPFAQ